MTTKADALLLPVELRVRMPMLDGSGWSGIGRALAVGDRVKLLDHGGRSVIEAINRIDWTLTVKRRGAGPLDPHRVVRIDPPRRNPDRCDFPWCGAFQPYIHDGLHDTGCPYGSGLDDFHLDRARRWAEDVATEMGRYPQYQGHYDTWAFGRATRDLMSKGGLQAIHGERVLVKPSESQPLTLPSLSASTTFFSLRLGWDCAVHTWDIDREN